MIVYEADKAQFLKHNDFDDIEAIIHERFIATTGHRVAAAELRSWKASLGDMAKVLRDPDLPSDLGVAIEMHIPQTSKRIDMTLTGTDVDGCKNAVVVELKQWEKAEVTDKDAIVKTFLGRANREVVHPSYQAWSYATLLEGFNDAVYDGGINIKPCAYLHNYQRDGAIDSIHYIAYTDKAPLFLKGKEERVRLQEFLKKYIKHGDSKKILYELRDGKIRPSKALAESLKGLLKQQPEFVLIDDQKEVFESLIALATAASSNRPVVAIIQGGPGTGKTVLAINLLVRLTSLGLVGKYVSKNAAPREVYQAKLTGTITKTKFSNMFTGSGSFVNATANCFDFLIVDEAHRLNEKSGLYGNLGENQVKELIGASKCTVFFIDEDQRVTLNDVGTQQVIRDFAIMKQATIQPHTLESQFRCGGSDGYLAWLDNTLAIRDTANNTLAGIQYDFRVFDSAESMHDAIIEKNTNNRARVVAGYCWPWRSKKDNTADDIVIGANYRRQWNLSQDGSLWIISPESVEQVGCIHTCQGLEVDYIGVIIGPDFVVRDNIVKTDAFKRDSRDRTIKGFKSRIKAQDPDILGEVDLVIKNTYRTLMTRGMRGCFIYCTDAETLEYFRSRLIVKP
jgi:DUF2075 family protein